MVNAKHYIARTTVLALVTLGVVFGARSIPEWMKSSNELPRFADPNEEPEADPEVDRPQRRDDARASPPIALPLRREQQAVPVTSFVGLPPPAVPEDSSSSVAEAETLRADEGVPRDSVLAPPVSHADAGPTGFPPSAVSPSIPSNTEASDWGMAGLANSSESPSLPPIRIGDLRADTVAQAVRAGRAFILARVGGDGNPTWWRFEISGGTGELQGRWMLLTTESRSARLSGLGVTFDTSPLGGPLRRALAREVGSSSGDVYLYFDDALARQVQAKSIDELARRGLTETWRASRVTIHASLTMVDGVTPVFEVINMSAAEP